jgi:putative copper export protein
MTVEFVLATMSRWIGFAALATLVGVLVQEVVILPPAASEAGPVRGRLARLGAICLVVLVVTTGADLLTRTRTMAGGNPAEVIAAVPLVLTRTHFGALWIARFVALALLLLICRAPSYAARVASLLLALGVTLTTSLTGHAADQGDFTANVAIDWVHVVAVSAWAGGLLCLASCVLGPASDWSSVLLGRVMRRFSRLAGCCLLAAALTGSYNAWIQVPRVSALWTTGYGRVLGAKLLLVLGLAWWGAVNRYTIVSRLGPARAGGIGARLFRLGRLAILGSARVARPSLRSRLRSYVGREAVLVLLILACTAVLVDSTPARHSRHGQRQVTPEPGPIRVTMEALHEGGGVPPGWVFVPPAGNAAAGRAVFVRLGCYACHRTGGGEKLPPSSGPGPDLTGVGQHHPAGYLFESIVNPNAVIVEGPGYTGPDGQSIMPDFRQQLSVTELIDLVAYLKTL